MSDPRIQVTDGNGRTFTPEPDGPMIWLGDDYYVSPASLYAWMKRADELEGRGDRFSLPIALS